MSETKRRLLWIDDDGPGRYEYERYLVEREGWSLVWAENVLDAVKHLAAVPFDALVVDQMLPFDIEDRGFPEPWGGCLVLRWLRGTYPPRHVPRRMVTREGHLGAQPPPLPANVDLHVLVVSAYHNEDVLREMRSASEKDQNLVVASKPLNERRLIDLIGGRHVAR